MNIDDLRIYLPKYLSSESEHELYSSLKDFPDNIDHRIYTNYLKDEPIIYQGDGINDLLAVNLPDVSIKQIPAMILSNTCDIDPTNKRNFPSQLVYAPIIGFNKYERVLKKDSNKSITQIDEYLASIRKQFITQIFYFPRIEDVLDDSIVFLDRIFNIGNDFVKRESLKASRIFTLSNYGNYLFLFKLSLHFTRIQDKVDRK